MIQCKAVASCYTGSIYLIFDENDYIDKYEIYRDGELLATYTDEDLTDNHQGENHQCRRPCLFDHDKHTNLFVKNSNHQWMFEDTNVEKFKQYSYFVKYSHGVNEFNTNTVYVTLK